MIRRRHPRSLTVRIGNIAFERATIDEVRWIMDRYLDHKIIIEPDDPPVGEMLARWNVPVEAA